MKELKLLKKKIFFNDRDILLNVRFGQKADQSMIKEMFETNPYGFYEKQIKDSVILDVGSYIGESTILFSIFGAKSIYAYEPHPTLFYLSSVNIAENNIKVKELNERAFGNKQEERKISGHATSSFGRGSAPFLRTTDRHNIKFVEATKELKRIFKIEKQKIVLKLDIEGYEEEVLKNIFDSIDVKTIVKNIIVEVHGKRRLDIIRKLFFKNSVTIEKEFKDENYKSVASRLILFCKL